MTESTYEQHMSFADAMQQAAAAMDVACRAASRVGGRRKFLADMYRMRGLYCQGKDVTAIALTLGRSKRFVYRHLTSAMKAG